MQFRLGLVVRLAVVAAIGLTVVAILLGRSDRRRPKGHRRMAAPRFQPLDDSLFPDTNPALRVLDLEAGVVRPIPLADGGRLAYAACSPWRDEQGRTQVCGAWKSAARAGSWELGLARYAIPTGEVLDRRKRVEAVPGSSPCWFPDTTLRVLFANLEGHLYRLSFEPPEGARDEAATTLQPVSWPSDWPAPGRPRFSELIWPTDSRLGGRVIATLTFPDRDVEGEEQPRSQLWWLRLRPDGLAIVEGARLIRPSPGPRRGERVCEEHLASVAASIDGRLALAYLVRRGGRPELELQLATLTIDAATGVPRAEEAAAVTVARNRAYTPPAFSSDCRWLYSFTPWPPGPMTLERARVLDVLDQGKRKRRFAITMRSVDSD